MILCCGEALIDMIPTPTENGLEGFVPHSGGAVFNTAIALGRLGARVGLMSGVSTDMFGQKLFRDLRASHVDTEFLVHSDRPSTLAFVQLVNGHATYSFFDENSAGRMMVASDLPTVPAAVNALYFGGISLACEPGADSYALLAEQVGAERAVMLDPNIRAGFISNPERYRARLARMLRVSDIVKVSDEDLNWIYPGSEGLIEKVAQLQSAGSSVVIVTRGGEGADAWLSNGQTVHVPVQKVTVVDTVGAGDTFNAGVMAALSEQGLLTKESLRSLSAKALEQALQFGASVAAITVSRAGANPPFRDELVS
jgi:fructokinase